MNKSKHFMTRVADFIVDRRRLILLIFAALMVFSVFSLSWVKVEEDITVYLAEDAEARIGLTILEEEFTNYATADVMIRNVTREQADQWLDKLQAVKGVLFVSYDGSDSSYRDGCALYTIRFSDVTESEASEQALAEIRALLADEDTAISSDVGYSLVKVVAEQMGVVLIFVVIVVLSVLLFTSSTYAEIPVMLITFAVAALINMGSAFLMGTISFVSNSVAIVLQLALSVDYAIIFCNRYKEEHETLDIIPAVKKALAASIPEIFASSLTTIAGLTAMTFMKFRLGGDMGVNLIKAIFCSLLTVFLFMPALLVTFGKAMDKTKHRRFVPDIPFIGKLAYATRHVVPVLFVALVIAAYVMNSHVTYSYDSDLAEAHKKTEHETAQIAIREVFGEHNMTVMFVPGHDYDAETALVQALEECDEVISVTSLATIEAGDGYTLYDSVDYQTFAELADTDEVTAKALFAYFAADRGDHRAATEDLSDYQAPLLDLFLFLRDVVQDGSVEIEEEQRVWIEELYEQLSMALGQLRGDNYSMIVLYLGLPSQSEESFAFLDRLHAIGERYYPEGIVLTGNMVNARDFSDSFASDNVTVGLMSLVLVMLILFFTFRSFGMPLLLILVIQGSIWLNFSIAMLRGDYVFFLCYLIVSAIQMGANIDYAIVVSSRYREFRETMDPKQAIINTLNRAFPTVITSGLMMVSAGLLIGYNVSQSIIAGEGYYVGTGTIISILFILFALPQLLLLGDRFVSITTVNLEDSALAQGFRKHRRRLAAGLLALASLYTLAVTGLCWREGRNYADSTRAQVDALLSRVAELRALSENLALDGEHLDDLKYSFAEQLVTEDVGSERLAEGEAQYQEGLAQYNEGVTQYDEGAELLDDAKEQYNVGAAQLAEGQAAYDEGLAQYNAAQKQVDDAKKQLAEGQAAYDAGKAQYEQGQKDYAAAEEQLAEGQAAYDEGKAQYEQGQKDYAAAEEQLAEGQAAYDEGEAQYQQALAEYQEAEELLNEIAPLYDVAMMLYEQYQELQAEYDAAVASGDTERAAELATELAVARMLFETSLEGYTLTGLMAEYNAALAQMQDAKRQLDEAEQQLADGKKKLDEGYAQLADAETQLAEAEAELKAGKKKLDDGYAQLADAKKQLTAAEAELKAAKKKLDDGYAQLADAEAQLADAKKELDYGKAQLDAGYAELADGKGQIDEGENQLADALRQLLEGKAQLDEAEEELEAGREQLAQNREELNGSLLALDSYVDDEQKLSEGVSLLLQQKSVSSVVGKNATTAEVLNAAEKVFTDARSAADRQQLSARMVFDFLMVAALLGLLALLLWALTRQGRVSAFVAVLSGLLAVIGFVFWRSRCTMLSAWPMIAAAALAIAAVLYAELQPRAKRGSYAGRH